MNANQIALESDRAIAFSASRYKAVDLTSVDFAPDAPFKAVHIGGDGNITIQGVDGAQATLAVTAGCWPYGGTKIIRATTTATSIIALY